ncbi:MAG: hypothetical protein V1822_01805, partial [Candidatus Micrarchaeota archaeon]
MKKCPDPKCEANENKNEKKFPDDYNGCPFCSSELVESYKKTTEVTEEAEKDKILPEVVQNIERRYMEDAVYPMQDVEYARRHLRPPKAKPRRAYSYKVRVKNIYYIVRLPRPPELVFYYVCP